ncbi:MAG: phospholipid carrier-dependent glycosyltransferase, partial [Clostridia bacterium]
VFKTYSRGGREEDVGRSAKVQALNGKMTRKDMLIALAMTLAYLAMALFNLGSMQNPASGWIPKSAGITFHVEFEEEVELSRITYLAGLGSDWYSVAALEVEYLDADMGYLELCLLEKPESSFMKWYAVDVEASTSTLRITSRSYENPDRNIRGTRGEFLELAFYAKGSNLPVAIREVRVPEGVLGVMALFDEQDMAVYEPGFMNSSYFDEVYFPRTAYEYMNGLPIYENTHPPLGKIIIMAGMGLFGVTPFGWRIMGTLAGAMMIPLMYLFAKRLFKSTFLAFCAGFLMAFDFMHFVQTRIGTADGYLVLFVIMMFYFMHEYTSRKSRETGPVAALVPLLLCGIAFGLAVSVKWIGAFAGAGIAFLFFHSRIREVLEYRRGEVREKGFYLKYVVLPVGMCILFFLVIPLALYFFSFLPVYRIQGSLDWFVDFLAYQKNMFSYHSGVASAHPFASEWWKWPFMVKPVYYYSAPAAGEGLRGSIVALGNPAIWWMGLVALFVCAIRAFREKDGRILVILAGYLSILLPWAVSPRNVTFLYHYFGCVPFLILALVLWFEYLLRDNPGNKKLILGFLGISALLFVLFYPALTGITVPEWVIAALRWLPSWWF